MVVTTNISAEYLIKRYLLRELNPTPDGTTRATSLWNDWVDRLSSDTEIQQAVATLSGVKADSFQEALEEFRESGSTTSGVAYEYSRNYESDPVGRLVNGTWVGWTYWYGGGKHSNAEGIDWISDSYVLDIVSEEVVQVVKRKFKKRG